MAAYLRAKKRILRNQEAEDWAVIGVDDDYGRKIVKELRAADDRRVVPISAAQRAEGGVYVSAGRLIDDLDGSARDVGQVDGFLHLKGAHNGQNMAAAYAAAVARHGAAEGLRLGAVEELRAEVERLGLGADILRRHWPP